ncbi:MAG: ATP-binding protein [Thermodesulfobacteriota bacterium]
MAKVTPLKPELLRWKCDESLFSFDKTDELTPLSSIIGQERALRSLDFGLGLGNHGYNIYVLGDIGTGKITAVKSLIEEKAAAEPVPSDWCYLFNFSDPDKPTALKLPPGKGVELKTDMEGLVETIIRDIPKIFESKDYEKHRDEIIDGQQERTKAIFQRLEQLAHEKDFILKKSVSGLSVLPAKDGKAMGLDEYEKLSRKDKDAIDETSHQMQDKLNDTIREARTIEKDTKERIEALDREMVEYLINPAIGELLERYKEFEEIVTYLGAIKEDIFLNIDDFRPKEELQIPGLKMPGREPSFERYQVNLLVNNKETEGAPVVIETNPTYYNLFGRIEHRVQYGVAVTDFTMIKAGAAHKANGGYLVLHALDVLRNIFVYDALKRLIKNKEAGIDDAWEQYRLVSATTLKPSPIPVDVKIVLIGEPYIYYLLYNMDSEFRKLFKVKADFDNVMERSEDTIKLYAEFIAARAKEEELLAFDRSAVAAVIEHAIRLSGDKEKLTARFNDIANLIVEAGYWAAKEEATGVTADHIEKAHKEKRYRNSKIEEKLQEYIIEDTIMVDTSGEVVGQINGLAVLSLGDHQFGKPSRVTAKTYMGDSGVVNLEREVKMSGPIHNKALMILTSFLGGRFTQDFPLTLSATICFEQLYSEIEGDSATCTETYALLSSLSGVPLSQAIAVTGSMNQRGEVQPIGGVNEKIEGFFDVCAERGLTGSQGVIIPKRNVKNLMLKQEVIEAVKEGRFAIYPIEMLDQGLEILTGKEAGERGTDGAFKKGTINALAAERLKKLASGYKAFGRPKPATKNKAKNSNHKKTKK